MTEICVHVLDYVAEDDVDMMELLQQVWCTMAAHMAVAKCACYPITKESL